MSLLRECEQRQERGGKNLVIGINNEGYKINTITGGKSRKICGLLACVTCPLEHLASRFTPIESLVRLMQ